MLKWNGAFNRLGPTLTILGLIAAVTAVLPWVNSRLRSILVLAGSIAAGAVIMRWLIAVPLLFAWLTVTVSRRAWPTSCKLALLLGTWLGGVLIKWFLAGRIALHWQALSMYWACLPAAVICLVVDRSRGQLGQVTARDEWTYLLAIPRFFLPFLQPIPMTSFAASRQASPSLRLSLSALALGIYAIACLLVHHQTPYSIKPRHEELSLLQHAPQILQNGVRIYAVNAAGIFCAVALLRLLGFSLGSGFRWPLLATSVNELFRRWNYYFYEFAFAYVYLPLCGWLRRWLPLKLAHFVAGYSSIVLGIWAIDNVIFQLAFGRNLEPTLQQLAYRDELVGYAFVWSLIVVAPASPGLRALRRRRWWPPIARLLTLAVLGGVLTLLFTYQVTMY